MRSRKNHSHFYGYSFLCLVLLVLCSCAGKVWIKQDIFVPNFSSAGEDQFSQYQGKEVYLDSVVNRAENTSFFHYYNPKNTIVYEALPSLTSYFWYCFQKAFMVAGIKVHENEKPENVPELKITLASIDDREFRFVVNLTGNGIYFIKDFVVSEPAPENYEVKFLEARAYKMVSRAAEEILNDKDFAREFTRAK